jgi:signal transduction histidine kinase
MAVLLILAGPHIGSRYELDHSARPTITIGRGGSTIVVLDPLVSQRHAKLSYADGIWTIEDLGSVHGTFVNSARIAEPVMLKDDDQIRCGETIILFLQKSYHSLPNLKVTQGEVQEVQIDRSAVKQAPQTVVADPIVLQPGFLKGSFELIEMVDSAIADLSDIKELLASVGWLLLCRPEVDCTFILLKNSDNKLEPTVELAKRPDIEYALQSDIVKQVLHEGKPVLIDDVSKLGNSPPILGKATAQSVLAVPIRTRQTTQGAIYLGSSKTNAFSQEQVNVLSYLGGHIGLALENLQLSLAAKQNQKFTDAGQSTVNLSHGIKNILQAIGGAAEVIDFGFQSNQIDRAKGSWEILKRNIDRLKKFTLDMLAFNRSAKPVFTSCKFNRIVESAVESLQSAGKGKGVSIVLEMDEQIPVRPMDADNMHDVVLNLVMNAIDAVEENKGLITVTTSYDRLKQIISLSVKDNGPGISPEERDKIWLPFHTTKPKGGTGLGLPIVRKIVDQHDGTIVLDSQPGCGAKFTINMPAKPIAAQA